MALGGGMGIGSHGFIPTVLIQYESLITKIFRLDHVTSVPHLASASAWDWSSLLCKLPDDSSPWPSHWVCRRSWEDGSWCGASMAATSPPMAECWRYRNWNSGPESCDASLPALLTIAKPIRSSIHCWISLRSVFS